MHSAGERMLYCCYVIWLTKKNRFRKQEKRQRKSIKRWSSHEVLEYTTVNLVMWSRAFELLAALCPSYD